MPTTPSSRRPTAPWPASITPTRTPATPGRRSASKRSARRTPCSPTGTSARTTTASAPFQDPEARLATWASAPSSRISSRDSSAGWRRLAQDARAARRGPPVPSRDLSRGGRARPRDQAPDPPARGLRGLPRLGPGDRHHARDLRHLPRPGTGPLLAGLPHRRAPVPRLRRRRPHQPPPVRRLPRRRARRARATAHGHDPGGNRGWQPASPFGRR